VRLLIERGAEVDSRAMGGWTPLPARGLSIRTPRGHAGSSRSRRKRERKEAGLLDSNAPLNSQWIPRDRETVT
jgi:hypothetical protein